MFPAILIVPAPPARNPQSVGFPAKVGAISARNQTKCGFLLCCALSANAASAAPRVQLDYAAEYDAVCAAKTSYVIEQHWKEELREVLPQWRRAWLHEGARLLDTVVKITGKPFPQRDFRVALSLCNFPSSGLPLVVNVRYGLKSFAKNPITTSVMMSTVMHEVLHGYVESILPVQTPLLLKYKEETEGVRSHLHLLALQKAAYEQLGWTDKLNAVIAKDERLPNKDYKRAWEIVNRLGPRGAFVTETRSKASVRRLQ